MYAHSICIFEFFIAKDERNSSPSLSKFANIRLPLYDLALNLEVALTLLGMVGSI